MTRDRNKRPDRDEVFAQQVSARLAVSQPVGPDSPAEQGRGFGATAAGPHAAPLPAPPAFIAPAPVTSAPPADGSIGRPADVPAAAAAPPDLSLWAGESLFEDTEPAARPAARRRWGSRRDG